MVADVHSLLVVVGRDSESQVSLRKAVVLARHLGTRVDLLLCDAEPVSVASEASAARILEGLRGSIAADDVVIETSWAGGTSLRDGISRRLGARRSTLVLRSIGGCEDSVRRRATPAERELLSSGCEAPLWLARRAAWAPNPRLAMAPDPRVRRCPIWGQAAVQCATMLARGSRVDLEVLEGTPPGSLDALLLPMPRAGDGAACARAMSLVDGLDCDLVLIPTATESGGALRPLSRRRAAPALSS